MKRTKQKVNPLAVEKQDVVSELMISGFELARISRVKYEGNPRMFVDVRVFRRGYGENDEEVFHPSKKGLQFKETDFLRLIEPYLEVAGERPKSRPVH